MNRLLFLICFIIPAVGYMQDTMEVEPPKNVTRLKVGKDIRFGDMCIKFIRVTEDSRCPQGVDCMWAGEVKALIGFYENGTLLEEKEFVFGAQAINKTQTKEIFVSPKKTMFAYHMSPEPSAEQRIDPKAYYLEFFIKEN